MSGDGLPHCIVTHYGSNLIEKYLHLAARGAHKDKYIVRTSNGLVDTWEERADEEWVLVRTERAPVRVT